MPIWIRNSLFAVMLLCCVIIGMRVYIALDASDNSDAIAVGAVSSDAMLTKLPEFTLNDMWGEPHSISEWAGKPLLINFWATWCAPCRREMPLLQALHTSQDDLQILGIAIDRQADVQTYMAESGISYPSLVGEEDAMRVSDLFGLEGLGLPFTVLIGAGGEVLTVFIGEIEAAELDEMADISRRFASGELSFAESREQLGEL
jgi:thiol-disulfide isomerase/thioredoxin